MDRKRVLVTQEKRLNKLHYWILIGLMIFFVLHFTFLEAKTIGHDKRYDLYIFWLPVVSGILILGIYRRDFLIRRYLSFKKNYEKVLAAGAYLIQGFIISFFSFGQASQMIWNYLNKKEAEKNPTEILIGNVTRFWDGKTPSVDFESKYGDGSFKINRETIRKYKFKEPKDHVLIIEVSKGLWDYYVVQSWTIDSKQKPGNIE